MTPEGGGNVFQQLWSLGLASLGGLANFLRKVQNDTLKRPWYIELPIDVFIGAFAGSLAFTGMVELGFNPNQSGMAAGVAGVLGFRFIDRLAVWYDSKFPTGTPPGGQS